MGAHVAPLFIDHLGQRLRLKPGLWPLRTAPPSSHSAFIVELSSLSLWKKKKFVREYLFRVWICWFSWRRASNTAKMWLFRSLKWIPEFYKSCEIKFWRVPQKLTQLPQIPMETCLWWKSIKFSETFFFKGFQVNRLQNKAPMKLFFPPTEAIAFQKRKLTSIN